MVTPVRMIIEGRADGSNTVLRSFVLGRGPFFFFRQQCFMVSATPKHNVLWNGRGRQD